MTEITDFDLDGEWVIVEARQAGELLNEPGAVLRIKGDHFERRTSAHVYLRHLVLKQDVSPKQIDLHILNDPNKGQVFLGIYEVTNATLRICHALPGRPRPSIFDSTRENQCILSVSIRKSS